MIDLDILFYGDEHIDSDQLQLPHPAICRRKFVLMPLLEIEPDALCPVDHRSYDECLALLNDPSQKVESLSWMIAFPIFAMSRSTVRSASARRLSAASWPTASADIWCWKRRSKIRF